MDRLRVMGYAREMTKREERRGEEKEKKTMEMKREELGGVIMLLIYIRYDCCAIPGKGWRVTVTEGGNREDRGEKRSRKRGTKSNKQTQQKSSHGAV